MKKLYTFVLLFAISFFIFFPNQRINIALATTESPKLAIVIDDFGGYEQAGVDTLMSADCPLTCAVIPFVDNTNKNIEQIINNGHELILHMPMQSHVNLPENWYGPIYIARYDSSESATEKLEKCLAEFDDIKGFNIHIGSGVSQNKELMKVIYNFAKTNDLYFLDSRTIETTATKDACKETNSIYLGRDVFLEADKNRSYHNAKYQLSQAIKIAKEKGYAIAIGHVGAEGGENTAKAIIDSIEEIRSSGVEIVPLSEIYNDIRNNY